MPVWIVTERGSTVALIGGSDAMVRQLIDLIDGDCATFRVLALELLRTFPEGTIAAAGHAVLTDHRAIDAVIRGIMG